MINFYYKLRLETHLALPIGFFFLFLLIFMPHPAYAQWPPFKFNLKPTFEGNRITYHIELSSKVDWPMTDVTIKVLLPEGTRYLQGGAQPTTTVDFDGVEVTFFTSSFNQKAIKDAFFTVEVVDPTVTNYTTHTWISWKGDQAGDYLTEEVSIDITKQPLNWQKPKSRLQLDATAFVSADVITYALYPTNDGRERMWDLKINVPVPAGTSFLSASAPAPFVANFNGQEVTFSIIELEREAELGPLTVKVSTEGVTTPSVETQAWATWKNGGRRLSQDVLAQEDFRTGNIVVQPHTTQQVVADAAGDVPFLNYDVTTITLQEEGPALKVTFYTVGELGPVGEPLEFIFYIDHDCRIDTGLERRNLGVEHRVRYRHNRGKADIYIWEELENKWRKSPVEVNNVANENTLVLWLSDTLFENNQRFCWTGEVKNRTEEFSAKPPTEKVPDNDELRMAQYVRERDLQ